MRHSWAALLLMFAAGAAVGAMATAAGAAARVDLMLGYADEQQTADVMEDGWFNTGDIARLVEVAAFYIKHRFFGGNPAQELEDRLLKKMGARPDA